MVTISWAFRYSVSGRSTGTLISTVAPVWSVPATRSVSRGSCGSGRIRGTGALSIFIIVTQASMTLAVSRYKAALDNDQSGSTGGSEKWMKVIGLAGWSGAGKTTLLSRLIPHFSGQGLRVSVIKHAHHSFDVDVPGKDSWVHRQSGATEVLVSSGKRWALMHELRGAAEPRLRSEEHT